MNQTTIRVLLGLAVALVAIPAFAKKEHGAQDKQKWDENRDAKDKKRDIDKLYELVRQTRAELQAVRVQAGIRGEHGGHHREGRGEHGGRHREGHGEHGERRGESEKGEEGGKRLGKHETWDDTRNGARLILAYDPAAHSFKGTVRNTTAKRLYQVRVEVHLSNDVELGPTERTDLGPGEKISVELSVANQKFNWWTTHPEHGSEEEHGPEHSGEEGREGDGNRPRDPVLRPLYNELQLLRHEVKILARGLRDRKP